MASPLPKPWRSSISRGSWRPGASRVARPPTLYSPIALGDHLTERSEQDAYRVMLRALDFGCVYYWYNDLTVIPTHRT